MRKSLKLFAAVALGALALSACGSKQGGEPEKVDLLDLLTANSVLKRDLTISSTAMKQEMKYNVYLPPKFDENAEYPILYLLHGAGDDQGAWLDKGNAQSLADTYIKRGGTPMIIVMPDAQMTFYMGDYETYFHEELMPTVEKAWKFSGKRAVAGLSMGGFGTLYHALKYPSKFTYGYAMSPAAMDWLQGFVTGADDKKVFPPFTIEVGNQDTTVDNTQAKALADCMQENGLSCEWIARDGIHYWNFWQECLPKALEKVGASFK